MLHNSMIRLPRFLALILCLAGSVRLSAEEATIHIDARRVLGEISPYLTGACIEDVNHEIYGGIYSQMVFGESFQEPSPAAPVHRFKAYGGKWELRDDEVWAAAAAGPTLVSEQPAFADGRAGVEIYFSDRQPGNAGLIVRLARPGLGADNFDGYEVSLDPQAQVLRLGRHRRNWQLFKDTPYQVPREKWISLSIELKGHAIAVSVDGQYVVEYEDRQQPLETGTVALRPWQREARFRNLWIETGGARRKLAFEPAANDRGQVSGMWRSLERGTASGRFELTTDRPFVGAQSQQIAFASGEGEVGVENQGLNRQGLCFIARRSYEGHLWARAATSTGLRISLESRDGSRSYAAAQVAVEDGDEWQRLEFTLTPDADDASGRLAVSLAQPGAVTLGHVFLQPGTWGRLAATGETKGGEARSKYLPDRKDVVEGLQAQGLTMLRYGGSMINHPEYRWKKMIGPRDRRPPTAGTWYPYSTNGWGILDFLDLCEAAGFLGIPALNMGESPGDLADFVEYVNGPADSAWGRRRADDGHPRPYDLRYIELGNEERVDAAYYEKFKPLAEAIWAKDRNIVIIVGDFVYDHPINDPLNFTGAASRITGLAGHQQILRLAREHDREVWFDVHIGTDGPLPSRSLSALPSYVEALEKIAGGARHKVVVFEFNAGNHEFRRALGNAEAINLIERLGGRVAMAASANCLQVDGQNDNDWNQGLLFMNPCRVWPQPPYFVTQMVARHYQPVVVEARAEGAGGQLDVSAKRSADGKTLVLQVVNLGEHDAPTRLRFEGFSPSKPIATVEELAAPLDAVNTAAQPDHVKPRKREWRHELAGQEAGYTFPARSFTVLRFR
ncbi:MAG TPA: family 16 glycoside hydrolase [Pirellulales bacterium]|nr:family 16 glycoside hydrolase [Pirellulales bacterium]